MDTSKTYIKMCDCEAIQEHTPVIGDFYWEEHIDGEETVWTVFDTGNNDYQGLDWGTVWLPRQDQLQEMVIKLDGAANWSTLINWILSFEKFLWSDYPITHFTSMEQLWLAFVMKEKYNKIWDGDKWLITTR